MFSLIFGLVSTVFGASLPTIFRLVGMWIDTAVKKKQVSEETRKKFHAFLEEIAKSSTSVRLKKSAELQKESIEEQLKKFNT